MLTPPPSGDAKQAEKYINQLISLVDIDSLDVFHTDLSKFDPSNLQDHYRIDLQEYIIEISHSKHPNTGKDSFVLLFNNIQNISEGNSQKVILAYMYLEDNQFMRVRRAFLEQEARKKKAEEERKLKAALKPVDHILNQIAEKSKKESSGVSISTPAIS